MCYLLREKILHHSGCPKCSFYPSIKTFSGILNVFTFFPSTVYLQNRHVQTEKKQAAHIFQLFSAKFPVSHFRHRNQWLQHAAECLLRMLGCLSFGVNWGVESTHCASCATAPLMLLKMHELQAMLFLGR